MSETTKVNYASGCGRTPNELQAVPGRYLSSVDNGKEVADLPGEYFNITPESPPPALTRTDSHVKFRQMLFSSDKDVINYDWHSVRWIGKIRAPKNRYF